MPFSVAQFVLWNVECLASATLLTPIAMLVKIEMVPQGW